jgi:hypothetical protein
MSGLELEFVKQMVADALGVQAARLTVTTKRPRKGRFRGHHTLVEARIGGCRVSSPWQEGMPVLAVAESLVESFKHMVERGPNV